jgi:hypothetical protein
MYSGMGSMMGAYPGMMYSGMGNAMGAQAMMGGMMSQGAAMGAPMLGGLGGMFGLDPLSLGMRAGGLAWRGGAGILGAGVAGMGTMAGVGIAGAGAAWAGGQMLSGAQQQMQLSRGMAQNFNFMNAGGGKGFMPQQSQQIGRELREMTHDLGVGGEMATFSELSRLATNMGRMGMGQNVRTVRDFKEKFKQMVDSVKTIATELGTSLEEAQKMMASMKQVGIFKPGQQVQASQMMRQTASGGLSMSEVSAMMGIGSQISRSVGGLGSSGALGGIKTIGQVWYGLQTGALLESDVYNATGLAGAEGRQAFSADMMSKSANFLRNRKGRIFLASVAGKGGTLDQDALAEWMSGGDMSTERTMGLARMNTSGTGRADFIRNEGRLRGEVLGAMGGMAMPIAYKQWLTGQGFDPTDMGDKAKLAFQRFSGLGRDTADAALKMISSMPEIMHQQRQDAGMTQWADKNKMRSQQIGVEGVQRKLEHMREGLQGKLEQRGAEIMKSGSDMIESWLSHVTGIYKREYTVEMDKAFRGFLGGTATGKAAFRKEFGSGSIAPKGMFSGGDQFGKGATPEDFYGGGGLLGKFFESPSERYEKAGYKFDDGMSMDNIQKRMSEVDRITTRAIAAPTKEALDLGKRHERMLRNIEGNVTGLGEERLKSYKQILRDRALSGDSEADKVLHKLETSWGGPGAQMAVLSGMQEGAGMGGARDLWAKPKGPGFDSKLSQMTDSERAKVYGKMLAGSAGDRSWTGSGLAWGAAALGTAGIAAAGAAFAVPAAIGAVAWGVGSSLATGKNQFGAAFDFFDEKMEDWFGKGPTSTVREIAGEQFNLEENQTLIAQLHGESKKERDEGFKTVTNRLTELRREQARSGKELSDPKKGEEMFLRAAKASQAYSDLWVKHGGNIPTEALEKVISDEELRDPTTGKLLTVANFKGISEGLMASEEQRRGEKFMLGAKVYGEKMEEEVKSHLSTGRATYDANGNLVLTENLEGFDRYAGDGADKSKIGRTAKDEQDVSAISDLLRSTQNLSRMATANSPEQAALFLKEAEADKQYARNKWKDKSIADKRDFASKLRGMGMEGEAEDVLYAAGVEDRISRGGAKGGAGGRLKAIGQIFGADLSEDDRKALLASTGRGGAEAKGAAAAFGRRMGIDAGEAEKLLGGVTGKDKGTAGDLAGLVARLKDIQDKTAAEKKKQDDPAFQSLAKLDAIKTSIKASSDAIVGAVRDSAGKEAPKQAGEPGKGEKG